MNINELRIGNYVNYLGEATKVHAIQEKINGIGYLSTYRSGAITQNQVEPILITEDWLLRFGLEKEARRETVCHGNYFSIGIDDYRYCIAYADFRGDWGLYIEYTDSPFSIDDGKKYPFASGIKHVHQLQNLSFALTGKELVLN